ncbi:MULTISPECIES: universal stress protein [unclassified Halomonas]|uniref:universal stress protein n=1 Tax=unclassified Halomonas TaxID=2609666 RepID=UPI002884DF39|nr:MULTISPECIES: universal stress protein [unclassified Halomonas]MDT0501949.1 universal stress protein [Halomonas sp. PAR7]MDT0510962.1 universal stress protein [Halomonas sp. LES1]MDT0592714.1 universal stress protein [Halomonas sp. PAR8]
MYTSILVPVDGSKHAQQALAVACQLAQQNETRLILLHIPEKLAHDTLLVWGIGAVDLKATDEELEAAGRKIVERAEQAARDAGISNVETQIIQGDPARAILSESQKRGVDAIVMGSRGLSDLKGFVVGSVSHKVAHAAECSVITVS